MAEQKTDSEFKVKLPRYSGYYVYKNFEVVKKLHPACRKCMTLILKVLLVLMNRFLLLMAHAAKATQLFQKSFLVSETIPKCSQKRVCCPTFAQHSPSSKIPGFQKAHCTSCASGTCWKCCCREGGGRTAKSRQTQWCLMIFLPFFPPTGLALAIKRKMFLNYHQHCKEHLAR